MPLYFRDDDHPPRKIYFAQAGWNEEGDYGEYRLDGDKWIPLPIQPYILDKMLKGDWWAEDVPDPIAEGIPPLTPDTIRA